MSQEPGAHATPAQPAWGSIEQAIKYLGKRGRPCGRDAGRAITPVRLAESHGPYSLVSRGGHGEQPPLNLLASTRYWQTVLAFLNRAARIPAPFQSSTTVSPLLGWYPGR